MNNADELVALEQCKINYNKFLLALNSLILRKKIASFTIIKNDDGSINACNWTVEDYNV